MEFLICVFVISLVQTQGISLDEEIVIEATTTPSNGSLQYYLCDDEGVGNITSDTTLLLSGGVHYLQEGHFCLLQNLNHFRIQGQKTGPRTVIHCHSDSEVRRGIAFFNITNLTLSHLQIINCGREIPSRLPGHVNETFAYLGPRQKAVVIISHCIDVTVESVSIDRCVGFGILFINPLGQTMNREVTIRDTTSQIVSECKNPWNRTDMLCSGSGMVAVFNDYMFADKKLPISHRNNKTTFIVNSSIFINNTNQFSPLIFNEHYIVKLTVGVKEERFPLFGGFSLAIYAGQKTFHVNVRVLNTQILSNRGVGGNFIIFHYNTIKTVSTQIDKLVVQDSEASSVGSGLVILGLIFLDSLNSLQDQHEVDSIYDIVTVTNSQFSHNTATTGASVLFHMTQQNISHIRMIVKRTNFTYNIAELGPAVHVNNLYTPLSSGEMHIYMEDVIALKNTFTKKSDILRSSPENTGVFNFGKIFNVIVVGTSEGGCYFTSNKLSVFMTTRTNLVFGGRVSFEENVGFRGGALSLIESSILFFRSNSNINFRRNRANQKGGAIFINTETAVAVCGIQYLAEKRVKFSRRELKLLNISLIFRGNEAQVAGNSVFGNPLYNCLLIPATSIEHESRHNLLSYIKITYEEIFEFQDGVGNGLSEMNSNEEFVCICSNNTFSSFHCQNSFNERYSVNRYSDNIIPGSTITVLLNTLDLDYNPVASLLYSFPHSPITSHPVDLGVNQEVISISGTENCSIVEFTIFATENVTVYIDLFVSVTKPKATIELQTALCPPGFTLEQSDGDRRLACLCSEFVTSTLESNCDITSYTITRPTHSWIGTTDSNDGSGRKTVQFAQTCPIDHCREDVTDIDLRVSDHVCVKDRTGTLCGRCREGLSSVFGSAECKECSHRYLGLLPLFALHGIITVIIGLSLDITITVGLVNGLWFYSNVVIVNSNIFFHRHKKGLLFTFLSWSNLQSGNSLCFFNGMTETAKVGLQYVYPTYMILIIGLVISLSQYSRKVQRLFSKLDGIHMLVTVIYFSFLSLFITVIDTFTFVKVISENQEEKHVWFFDGNKEASDPDLLFLIILGCLTLVGFILPYIIFFTFPNYIQRWINSTRLNAYVDASLAPYKDNMRFWFGARLVLASFIYIITTIFGTDDQLLALILQLSLLVGFAIVQAYIRPFKKVGVAIIDMCSLLSLIAITLGTLYIPQEGDDHDDGHKEHSNKQNNFIDVSLSIFLLLYIAIFFWHLVRRLRQRENIRIKIDNIYTEVKIFFLAVKHGDWKEIAEMVKEKEEGRTENERQEDPVNKKQLTHGEDIFEMAVGLKTTHSVVSIHEEVNTSQSAEDTSLQLREPVLDFVKN